MATATFDGTYWLDSVPKLTNFYVTSQASIYGDEPRPEVVGLIDRYKAKFRKRGHAVRLLGLRLPSALAKAVEKAGTLDLDKVVAVLNTYHDEPTVLGRRSFSPKLHIQDQSPLLVVSINEDPAKPRPLAPRCEIPSWH